MMESEAFQKQMFSTNRREKIFNVRKMPYKQFDNEKYLKSNFSPFQKKQMIREPASTQPKKGDYLLLTVASTPHKDLNKKLHNLKEEHALQKQHRLQKLKERQQQLSKYKTESQRLQAQKQKLLQRRQQIKAKIEEIRERNEIMRQQQIQRNEEIRLMNMQYLRNMIMGMRYQNGMEIDTDNMTYEELLQLQEKMGSVSKGLTAQQFEKIHKITAKNLDQVCSICYYNIKDEQEVIQLPCKHYFHVDCIKEWLLKERTCPMCKQEIIKRETTPIQNART